MSAARDSSWIIGKRRPRPSTAWSPRCTRSPRRPAWRCSSWRQRRRCCRRHRVRHRRRRAVHERRRRRRRDGLPQLEDRQDRRGRWLEHGAARRPRGHVRARTGGHVGRAVRLARHRGNASNEGFRAPIVPGHAGRDAVRPREVRLRQAQPPQILAPAIRLAEEGFPSIAYVASTTAFHQRDAAAARRGVPDLLPRGRHPAPAGRHRQRAGPAGPEGSRPDAARCWPSTARTSSTGARSPR